MYGNEINTTQEQIAATIAHEIKNPLALIRATLQYVEQSDKETAHKKNYDVMYREIDRINEIVVDYLESAGQQRADLKSFYLTDLIMDVEQTFCRSLTEDKISLFITIIDENIKINADYNKLKQVFINILQNAQDAINDKDYENETEQGKIEISIFKSENLATVKITDNGKGISENDITSIGTPFFTTKKKGTGLGISISKGIIRMHKGSLNIMGVEGKGTTVSIHLPI